MVVYSAQRLGLFVLALVGLYLLRMGGWLWVVLAALIAWALSYVLLGRSRDAAALWLHERVSGRRRGRFAAGLDADAAAEDAEVAEVDGRPGTPTGASSDGQADAEQDAVAELEEPGAGQDGPQQGTPGAEHHGAGEQGGRERQQQHEQ